MLLNMQRRRRLERRPSDWVFASPTGKLWAERNFNRAFDKIRSAAQAKGIRPLNLHCTRHSFITWALADGTSAKRVSEWCSVTVAVIERTYAHVLPDGNNDVSFAEFKDVGPPVRTTGQTGGKPGVNRG
jgi:integrase